MTNPMSTKKEKCDCAEMSCQDDCTRNHTHKTFSCKECQSESIEWDKEFDKEFFDYNEKLFSRSSGNCVDTKEVKSFISKAITTAVAKREKELAGYLKGEVDMIKRTTNMEGNPLRDDGIVYGLETAIEFTLKH